jgi:hypothetical protein
MRRNSRLYASLATVIGLALATSATASATPRLYLLNEGSPLSVGTPLEGEWPITLFDTEAPLAQCVTRQGGVLLTNGRVSDAMLFEKVLVSTEGCFEVPPFDSSGVQEGSAAKLTLTVAGTATMVFKPNLVFVEGLAAGGSCRFAIKKLEGGTSLNGASFGVSGAAIRLPKLSSVNCPTALLVESGGGVSMAGAASVLQQPLETEVRPG